MSEAILSSKYQIVIPREARKALGVKAGDKLLVVVDGDHLILMEKPMSFAKALRGLGRGLYGRNYLKKERESWDLSGLVGLPSSKCKFGCRAFRGSTRL